jgi:hypothetical protein
LQKLELFQTLAGRPRWNEADQPGVGSPQPVAPPPLQPLAFAAHERPQPATNDFDLSQGLSTKFDLGLKHANIPQRNGWNHKVVDVILQTTQGGLNPEHFQPPYATLHPYQSFKVTSNLNANEKYRAFIFV